MRRWFVPRALCAALLMSAVGAAGCSAETIDPAPIGRHEAALTTTFAAGSLIVPMDTQYQDNGVLSAYGMLYQLLMADVPVHWVIKSPKVVGDIDFTAQGTDFATGATISPWGYRGGPFVIEAGYATAATPLIGAWQAGHPGVTVHIAGLPFTARTGRLLTAAPSIAIMADGKQQVAFNYLKAAGITDPLGAAWSDNSPGVLTVADIGGPTTTNHADGALFRPSGEPAYCQVMTMHWGVKDVVDEVVAEYRSFLGFPTHLMAECQAVNALENNVNGRFLTYNGFLIDNNVTGTYAYHNSETPFAQIDGSFELVGGSERAYTLPTGDVYKDMDVVMITDGGSPIGTRDIWMTGYIDGACLIGDDGVICNKGVGKVSYLGGHEYDTKMPLSQNPKSNGTRLFLNSLFEAACATDEGQPTPWIVKSGPATTSQASVTYTLSYGNGGPGGALAAELKDALPSGVAFSSCSGGCTVNGQDISWSLGDLNKSSSGSVTLTVTLAAPATYVNSASLTYSIGLNRKTITGNSVTTVYAIPPDAGVQLDSGTKLDSGGGVLDSGAKLDSGGGILDGGGGVIDSGGGVLVDGAVSTDSGGGVLDAGSPRDGSRDAIDDAVDDAQRDGGGAKLDMGGGVTLDSGARLDTGGGVTLDSGAKLDTGGGSPDSSVTPDSGVTPDAASKLDVRDQDRDGWPGDAKDPQKDGTAEAGAGDASVNDASTSDSAAGADAAEARDAQAGSDARPGGDAAPISVGGSGGCDCRVANTAPDATLWLLLLGALLLGRRRRRSNQ